MSETGCRPGLRRSRTLEAYPSNDWSDIDGISYIDSDEEFVKNPNAEKNGSACGKRTMDAHLSNWGSATTAKLNKFNMERLLREIGWFAENALEFIFCYNANFGILPRDFDLTKYVADLLHTGDLTITTHQPDKTTRKGHKNCRKAEHYR